MPILLKPWNKLHAYVGGGVGWGGETEREESEYSILQLILKIDGDFELIINAHVFCFKVDHRNLFLPIVSVLSP